MGKSWVLREAMRRHLAEMNCLQLATVSEESQSESEVPFISRVISFHGNYILK